MAIKYECDVCHEVKSPADTYGPGVHPGGRPLVWSSDRYSTVGLTILPTTDVTAEGFHICGACLGKTLRRMVDEIWPRPTLVLAGKEVKLDDADSSGSDSASPDVREVRPSESVPRPSADVVVSPGSGPVDKLCTCEPTQPDRTCIVHGDPDYKRRVKDNPQA